MADGDLFIHVTVDVPVGSGDKPATPVADEKPTGAVAQPRPHPTATPS